MSSDLSKHILIGTVVGKPSLRYLADFDANVLTFHLSVTKKWVDGRGLAKSRTSVHTVTLFGKQADRAALDVIEGARLHVEGDLVYRKDKEHPDWPPFTEIQAQYVTPWEAA